MILALIFRSNERHYGLEIDAVREIVDQPRRYPIPASLPYLKGVINVHGDVLPVIDLPALMGAAGEERDERLVVLTPTGRSLALEVEKIDAIRRLDRELSDDRTQTEPMPDPFSRERIECPEEQPVDLLDLAVIYEQLDRLYTEHGGNYAPASNDRR